MSRPQKRRFQNDDEKKEKYNSTISRAIADIIRFSMDDHFRSECFQLMQVDNTNDFQLAIKGKLDSLINTYSNTSTLQKRPSFHDEAERNSLCSKGNEMIEDVNTNKNTDEAEETCGQQNTEMPSSPLQDITDSYIAEIANFLDKTNILKEENMEDMLPGTSGAVSETFFKTDDIEKSITDHNINSTECELTNKINEIEDFWPTEECCLWDSNINQETDEAKELEEEINDIDLNDNDTDWQ